MEEYALAFAEADYEDPGEHSPMGFMATGGGFHDRNTSHWWDHPPPHLPSRLVQIKLTGRPPKCTWV